MFPVKILEMGESLGGGRLLHKCRRWKHQLMCIFSLYNFCYLYIFISLRSDISLSFSQGVRLKVGRVQLKMVSWSSFAPIFLQVEAKMWLSGGFDLGAGIPHRRSRTSLLFLVLQAIEKHHARFYSPCRPI